jgi:phosphoribosylglycinamide formyltransferase-1
MPPNLAILLSGSGRTLDNLLAHERRGSLPARIALVIASADCLGLHKARAANIPALLMPGTIPQDQLASHLAAHHIQFVALAGYLKLLRIPRAFQGRITNIHPSLLPAFGGKGMHGMHVHRAVLASGATTSGCTVHLVDDQFDTGPVLAQMRCPVLTTDTPESLAARVFDCECALYPRTLAQLITGRIVVPQLLPAEAP